MGATKLKNEQCIVAISERGQVVIPAEVRKLFNLDRRAELSLRVVDGQIILIPLLKNSTKNESAFLKLEAFLEKYKSLSSEEINASDLMKEIRR